MRQPLAGDDAGFSLAEMLAAMAVLMVMASAVAGGLVTATKASASSRSRVVAASLATQDLEQARSTPAASLVAPSSTTSSLVVDGRTYTLTRTVSWRSAPGTVNRCSGVGTGRFAYKHVSVAVRWPGATTPLVNDTLITPPGGDTAPDTGSQRVRVLDRGGALLSGVTVSIAGPSAAPSQTTDGYGCVLFPSLSPGTYTITLTQGGAGGYAYVDPAGSTAMTRTVSISGTDTPPLVEMQLDLAGAISVTPVSSATGGEAARYVVTSGLGARVGHTALTPTGSRAGTLASPSVVSNLFPYRSSQYTAWAGTCDDADPTWHGHPRPAPVLVTSGTTTATTATTRPVKVEVKKWNGAPHTADFEPMHAVHAATGGCGPVANPGILGGSVGMTVPFTTDANGLAWLSLPYGTWRFEPLPGRGVYSANSVTLTPASPTAPTTYQVRIY